MNRRALLGSVGTGALVGASGCLATVKSALPLLGGCPDPGLEPELSYEAHDARGVRDATGDPRLGWNGAILIADPDDVDRPDDPRFADEDSTWIDATDFTEHVVVAIQTSNSAGEDDPEITGVGRDEETIHVHTCVPVRHEHDDWNGHSWLLRVPHAGDPPAEAVLTHWVEDERTTYD